LPKAKNIFKSLYLRSLAYFGLLDIRIRNSEFVTKALLLWIDRIKICIPLPIKLLKEFVLLGLFILNCAEVGFNLIQGIFDLGTDS